jgi:hypothetical protein
MAQIKLLGRKVIRQIKKRLKAGEKSTTIAADYGVSSGHIRKIRIGMLDENNPNGRWGYIKLDDDDE